MMRSETRTDLVGLLDAATRAAPRAGGIGPSTGSRRARWPKELAPAKLAELKERRALGPLRRSSSGVRADAAAVVELGCCCC